MDPDERIAAVRVAVEEGELIAPIALMRQAMADATDPGQRLHLEAYASAFQLAINEVAVPPPDDMAAVLARLDGPEGEAVDAALRARLRLELRCSAAVLDGDEPALDAIVAEALQLRRHHPAAGGTAARAVSNRLAVQLARLEAAGVAVGEPGHLDAALAIGAARALADVLPRRGTVDRRSVVAAIAMGDAALAAEWTEAALAAGLPPSEVVALHAHAAFLAWERGDLAEAEAHGDRARRGAQGRSADWTRTLGALGGVIAAASGGASLPASLSAYRRTVPRLNHSDHPSRAFVAGAIALEAGADPDRVDAMLVGSRGPRETWDPRWRAFVAGTAGRASSEALRPLDAWCDGPCRAWLRAASLRMRASARLRDGDALGAAADVALGLRLVERWPGRRAASLRALQDRMRPAGSATAAQAAVLPLVVQGLSDREIAARLGRSPRTVESHVRALLRAYGAPNRVALAVAASSEAMHGS